MTKEYLDLKLDFMFKQLFGQPARKHITLAFLNDLLGRRGEDRITDLTFGNTELIKDSEDGKTSQLDLVVVTELGEHINVEIQVRNQHDMPERTLYYWAKTYSSLISSGANYRKLTPTIFISILNYPLFPSITDQFHSVFHIREDTENFVWSDQLEFHLFDLSNFMVKWRKYRRAMKEKATSELPWLLMLSAVDYRKKKLEQELFSDLEEWAMNIEEVREALIEWETLSANKENRVLFEARAKELRDLLSNLEGERRMGKEEGRKETLKQVAIDLLKDGMSIESVAKYSKLPVKDIEKLKEKL